MYNWFRRNVFLLAMAFAALAIACSYLFTYRALSDLPRVHLQIVTAEERLTGLSQLEATLAAMTSRFVVLAWGGDDYDTSELIETVARSEQLIEKLNEPAASAMGLDLNGELDETRLMPEPSTVGSQSIESAAEQVALIRQLILDSNGKGLDSVDSDTRQRLRLRSRLIREELKEAVEKQQELLTTIQQTAAKERSESIWALFSGHGVMLAVVGLLFVARQSERTLRIQSSIRVKQQEAMLAEIPEPLHILDSAGRVVYWNRGAERLFGYTAFEMIGKVESERLRIEGFPTDEYNVHQLEATDADRWIGELDATANDGRLIRIERRRTKINEDGDLLGEVILDLDLGERKRQQQVQRRRQRLESLGTLASGIAHDLNNLLTPILMSSRMLQRENANIDRKALLETISSGASRGADLIAQLLTFARGGDGQHEVLRVDELVLEVVPILKHTLPKTMTLHTEVEPDLPPIMGDATEISQVLMNLAINARDAMLPKPGESDDRQDARLEIVIQTKRLQDERSFSYVTLAPGQYVAITVTDTGRGIPTTIRERMFDPFFTTKERGQGTGLGLSTSLGIVRSHRGAIDVKSSVGDGTSITVLLPALVQDSLTASEPSLLDLGMSR